MGWAGEEKPEGETVFAVLPSFDAGQAGDHQGIHFFVSIEEKRERERESEREREREREGERCIVGA